MTRKKIFMTALLFAVFCAAASAQDWKSIIGGVVKEAVGDKLTTLTSIIGTWEYVSPDCQFESENLLAKAGGAAASSTVEGKLESVYKKIGLNTCIVEFSSDDTYALTIKGKTTKGTYTFDSETKTVTFTTSLRVTVNAQVAVMGSSMSLLFNADKLLSAVSTLSGLVSKVNSTASTVNSLISSYEGMLLGVELKKK